MNTPNQPVSQGTNYSNTDHAAFDEITNPNTGCDDTRLSPSLDDTPDLEPADDHLETRKQADTCFYPEAERFHEHMDEMPNSTCLGVYEPWELDDIPRFAVGPTFNERNDMTRQGGRSERKAVSSYWREVAQQIAEIELASPNEILDPHAETSFAQPETPQDLLRHRDDFAQTNPEPGSPAATENVVRRANYILAQTCLKITGNLAERPVPEDHDDQLRQIAKLHGIALTLKAVREVTKPIVKLPKVPGRPGKRW